MITLKQYQGYKKARKDKWGPSFNENYNKAVYGISSEEFYRVNKILVNMFGMFIPTLDANLPSLKQLNDNC